MAKNETKSQAELYREERKARIAKAAKQNAKNIEKSKKAGNIIKKIVAVVLVIAIICGLGVWVNSLTGASKKLTKTMTISAGSNTYKVDAVEFMYYYSNYYNNLYSMSSQYTQYYGYDPTGFDTTLEGMTTGEDGEEITWAEALKNYAIEGIKNNYALYDAAILAGVTLDEDEKAEIDSTIEEITSQADEYGYSLNAFLAAYYGNGMNEKTFRKIAERQAIAEKYSTQLETECTEAVETSEIETVYNESKKDYDYVDVHYYTFTAETLTAEDGEVEKDFNARQDAENEKTFDAAQAVFDKITDLASFEAALAEYEAAKEAEKAEETADEAEDTTEETAETATDTEETAEEATEEAEEEEVKYSTELVATSYKSIESATNTDMADWIYSEKRKAVKKIVKDEDNKKAYVLYIDKTPYTSYSVDYYDCLVVDSEGSDGETVTASESAATLLKGWDKTEEGFATMTTNNSTGETGIIEDARITSVSDNDVKAWLYSSDRKAGDTTTIETDSGTHILYFKAADKKDIDQYQTIKSSIASDNFDAKSEEIIAGYTVVENDKAITKQVNDYVKKLQRNAAQSS